jgi:hypothetical protein
MPLHEDLALLELIRAENATLEESHVFVLRAYDGITRKGSITLQDVL